MALATKAQGKRGLLVPIANAHEASVVDGVDVYAVGSLAEAVDFYSEQLSLDPVAFSWQDAVADHGRYPIHPEVFNRLFEDWTTLESFQRTRGVLKLVAKVIYRLWKDQNADHMILPGSLPLYDGDSRNELVYYLAPGWDAVLEKDIDGERVETTALDTKETRFGQQQAARRVARTLFLGSAPSSGGTQQGVRGIDRARVLIGCL